MGWVEQYTAAGDLWCKLHKTCSFPLICNTTWIYRSMWNSTISSKFS